MATGFFNGLNKVTFEGADSTNPLAFRHYDADAVIMGKRMEDHLRFAVAWWHSIAWEGGDPFGGQTFERPWHPQDNMANARLKADVAFEMFDLLDVHAIRCLRSSSTWVHVPHVLFLSSIEPIVLLLPLLLLDAVVRGFPR